MDSIVINANTLDVMNDILNDITRYGSDRKANFSVELFNEEDILSVNLIYKDTGKVIFTATIKQESFVKAMKSEDDKEKEREKLEK